MRKAFIYLLFPEDKVPRTVEELREAIGRGEGIVGEAGIIIGVPTLDVPHASITHLEEPWGENQALNGQTQAGDPGGDANPAELSVPIAMPSET